MKNAKKAFSLGAALVMLGGIAASPALNAQTGGTTGRPSEPTPRSWIPFTSYGYVGGSIGRSDYDLGSCAFGLSCDDRATGFKIYTGGRFSRHFGMELGYVHLGEADRNGGNVKAQGANLNLVGTIPLGTSFSIFGKVGGIYGWTKTTTSVAGARSGKDDALGLSYGAGLQYDINKIVALRADWDRYRLKYVSERDDADLYSVGVVIKF